MAKLLIASDLHGSAYYTKELINIFKKEKFDKLILLGDLLYHGPRNPLTKDYNPMQVSELLNEMKDNIIAVRGNCDSEVDQMVLEFPIMADYATIFEHGKMIFLTHGHLFNEAQLPNFKKGDVLVHGHTHLTQLADKGDYIFLNPGSMSLPKGDCTNSYATYENGVFCTKTLQGEIIDTLTIN